MTTRLGASRISLVLGLKARRQVEQDLHTAEQEATDLTSKIAQLDQEKADAIAAAKMPVDGLTIGDGCVLLNGVPFEVQAPNFVELLITQSDPGVQGNTAQGATKPATLESGATIQVPLFIEEGERVKVDTRTGEYLGRA